MKQPALPYSACLQSADITQEEVEDAIDTQLAKAIADKIGPFDPDELYDAEGAMRLQARCPGDARQNYYLDGELVLEVVILDDKIEFYAGVKADEI